MKSLLEQYLDHVHQQTAFRSGKMEVGKVRSTLLREQGFSGEVTPRHAYAEKRVAAGNVELDFKRKHFKNPDTDTLLLFSDVTLAVVDYTDWLLARMETNSTSQRKDGE
jgi:hypothetical protein